LKHKLGFSLPSLIYTSSFHYLSYTLIGHHNAKPSVRKQHNAGYKHKANVRTYYQQYEAQQNQYLIDLKVKEHLGQAAAFQQVGAAYNQLRPRLPVPMMPMPGNPMMPMPGMRPLAPLPRPIPGYPGMPPMVAPPGAPSMPGQVNPNMPGQVNPSIPGQINNGVPRPLTVSAPMMAPGSSGTPTSGTPPPMFAPTMYQSNPSASAPGGFQSPTPTASAQPQETNH
ncbi:hypothetical protein M8C21_001796, partial [Ambrosia artemisiifolia]